VTLPDQLTVARAASVPLVVLLYAWEFPHNEYWATALFCVAMATDWFDGRIARSRGVTSPLGSLLDPIADKVLVLAVLVMLIEDGVWPGWMVAAIVAREILISGLRLAAIERGVVIAARDLGKLKTWAQAIAAARRPARGTKASAGGPCSSPSCSRGSPGSTTPGRRRGCCAARLRRPERSGGLALLAPVAEGGPGAQIAGQLRESAGDLDLDRDHADRAERLLGGAGWMVSTPTTHSDS
jgi:CDP-diacylglycerol--glycerol-3-phosphate 3-phosphatidyltransferase